MTPPISGHPAIPDNSGDPRWFPNISKANPLATIFAVAMLLEHLDETTAADRVNTAALRVLNERIALTADLGGTASTQQVGDAVVSLLQRNRPSHQTPREVRPASPFSLLRAVHRTIVQMG